MATRLSYNAGEVRRRALLVAAYCFLLTLHAQPALGSGAYCGMYALYGAAVALDAHPRLEELLTPEFVSSSLGSTDEDIRKAAATLGLHTTALRGLGRKSLLHSKDPLLLHVVPRGLHGSYTHWLLFLGVENGRACVFDGSGGEVRCNLEDLLARWDGKAVAVHRHADSVTRFTSLEYADLVWLLLVGIVASQCSLRLCRFASFRRTLAVSLLLVGMATCLSFAHARLVRTDATAAGKARAGIASTMGYIKYADIGFDVLQRRLSEGSVNLIDARYASSFETGYIASAINIPVDTGWGNFRSALKQLDRSKPVVVYCQSAGCGFSDYVASMLTAEGLKDVLIYRDGYAGWTRSMAQYGASSHVEITKTQRPD